MKLPLLHLLRKLILITALFSSIASYSADWNTPLHIGGSATLTLALYVCVMGPWAEKQDKYVAAGSAAIFTFAFGYALEQMDASETGKPMDVGDLEADAIGAIGGAVLIYFLDIKGAKATPGGIAFNF